MQNTITRLAAADLGPALERTARLLAAACALAFTAGLLLGTAVHRLNDQLAAAYRQLLIGNAVAAPLELQAPAQAAAAHPRACPPAQAAACPPRACPPAQHPLHLLLADLPVADLRAACAAAGRRPGRSRASALAALIS